MFYVLWVFCLYFWIPFDRGLTLRINAPCQLGFISEGFWGLKKIFLVLFFSFSKSLLDAELTRGSNRSKIARTHSGCSSFFRGPSQFSLIISLSFRCLSRSELLLSQSASRIDLSYCYGLDDRSNHIIKSSYEPWHE